MVGQPGARAPLPNWTGDALGVVTTLVLAFYAVFLVLTLGGSLWPQLLSSDWTGPSGFHHSAQDVTVYDIVPRVIVGIPIVGLGASVFFARRWLLRRGQMSTRIRLVWALALSGAVLGWPVACGCVFIEGYGKTGGMVR
jgi:hypothetical protein